MRRKWLGLVQPDDAANRQLPMLTPSSHVLYLVIFHPRSSFLSFSIYSLNYALG
jgi:hypothetical protein